MGGRFPGVLPPKMRAAAVAQALVLVGLALIVLSRAGMILVSWKSWTPAGIWLVVAVSAASLAMNVATTSRWERRIWAPVGAVLTATSLLVALGP